MRECGGRIIHLKGNRDPRTDFFSFLMSKFLHLRKNKINQMYILKTKISKTSPIVLSKNGKNAS